eukprot:SAG22_NODE_606_length_8615_cov_6.190348_6_plen_71_part_00
MDRSECPRFESWTTLAPGPSGGLIDFILAPLASAFGGCSVFFSCSAVSQVFISSPAWVGGYSRRQRRYCR